MRHSIRFLVSALVLLFPVVGFANVSRFTIGNLPACGDAVAHGKIAVVTDATTDEDCTVGGEPIATAKEHACICDWDGAVGTWRLHSHSSIDNGLVINESGLDVDFRVEGDNEQNLIRTDGTTDRVGIAVSAPEDPLHILSDSGGQAIHLEENSGSEDWQIGIGGSGTLNFFDSGAANPSVVFQDAGLAAVIGANSAATGTRGVTYTLLDGLTPANWNTIHIDGNANIGAGIDNDIAWSWNSIAATAGPAVSGIRTSGTEADLLFSGTDADARVPILRIDGSASEVVLEVGVLSMLETTAPTATTNYGKIWTESNNELFFQDGDGNTHLLHGDAFGNLWHHGVSAATMTISTQGQATLIDTFSVVGGSDDLGNVTGSASTNLLTIGANGVGFHDIGWHSSFSVGGGAGRDMIILPGIVLASTNTVTGATETTPIVLTIGSHVYENGDMIEVVSVGGNTAANGTRIVQNVSGTTVDLYDTQGAAVASNGTYISGGEITIFYPGELLGHRTVSHSDPGVAGGGGPGVDVLLAASDAIGLYVVNNDSTNDLLVLQISLGTERIGD